jgi:hypothetical protein
VEINTTFTAVEALHLIRSGNRVRRKVWFPGVYVMHSADDHGIFTYRKSNSPWVRDKKHGVIAVDQFLYDDWEVVE